MARGAQSGGEAHDWVTRAADDAIRHAQQRHGDDLGEHVITCASGASPSGPVHLGNLREFLTVHFVAEEIKRRGVAARHLHSWDDYDRFRKVPAGIDPSWSEHIGRPLSAVPDPWGCHDSWAEHYKEPLVASLRELGVEMVEVSQTEQYRAGTYREQILTAVRRRDEIEQVMSRYRTKAAAAAPESEEEAAAMADSVANDDESGLTGLGATDDLARFPYKPYCRDCGRDTTIITAYDDATTDLSYTCTACSYDGVTNLSTDSEGKLVWKVDWPMRWEFEGVDFEPGGVDHACPGSSYTVGKELVKHLRRPRAVVRRLLVRRRGRPGQDVVLARRRADRGRRAARSSRRRSCAGSTCVARPSRRSTSTSAPRWSGCTTSGTRSAEGGRPRQAGRSGARLRAGLVDDVRRHAADARRGGPLQAAVVGRRRDRRQRRADQPDRRRRRPRARVGRRPGAAARQGDDVDVGLRAGRGPDDGPRDPGRRAARRTVGGRGALAAPAARPAARPARARRDDLADLRRAEARSRARPRRRARPTRSRPTRRASSGCSTTCWSTPSAVRGCRRCSWRWVPTRSGGC